MSQVQQGPAVDASATQRGLMNILAQTLAGPKTFNGKVTIGDQGGTGVNVALGLSNLDLIEWANTGGASPAFYGVNFAGQGAIRAIRGPWITDSNYGFCMGGINSAFGSTGMFAAAQSYLVDVYQGQTVYGLQLYSNKGAATGEVVTVGSAQSPPHNDAELLRVAYGLSGSYNAPGTAVFKLYADGRLDIATGGNKEFRMGGNPILSPANDGGMGVLGFKGDSGGQAALNFGNSTVLTDGLSTDLARWRNGNPFSGTLAGSLTPGGKWWGLGGYSCDFTDDGASAGNKTQNTPAGRAAMTNATAAVTITSNKVGVNDHVHVDWEDDPGAGKSWWVTVAAGSFTLNVSSNVGANKKFRWSVMRRNN